jgi:hypothetical protein
LTKRIKLVLAHVTVQAIVQRHNVRAPRTRGITHTLGCVFFAMADDQFGVAFLLRDTCGARFFLLRGTCVAGFSRFKALVVGKRSTKYDLAGGKQENEA